MRIPEKPVVGHVHARAPAREDCAPEPGARPPSRRRQRLRRPADRAFAAPGSSASAPARSSRSRPSAPWSARSAWSHPSRSAPGSRFRCSPRPGRKTPTNRKPGTPPNSTDRRNRAHRAERRGRTGQAPGDRLDSRHAVEPTASCGGHERTALEPGRRRCDRITMRSLRGVRTAAGGSSNSACSAHTTSPVAVSRTRSGPARTGGRRGTRTPDIHVVSVAL